MAISLQHIFHFAPRKDLVGLSPAALIILVVILGPLLETLIFQALPVGLMRCWQRGAKWQFLFSVALFAAAHFLIGVPTGMSAGLIGGSYLAFTYLKFRDTSFSKAVWLTAALHGAYNLGGVSIMLVSTGAPVVKPPIQAAAPEAAAVLSAGSVNVEIKKGTQPASQAVRSSQ